MYDLKPSGFVLGRNTQLVIMPKKMFCVMMIKKAGVHRKAHVTKTASKVCAPRLIL